MRKTPEVKFYPNIEDQLSHDAQEWLAMINDSIKTQGVTTEVAKTLILNQQVLDMHPATQRSAVTNLSKYFGLQEDKSDYLSPPHIYTLKAAVDYERFNVDPFVAIADFRGQNWQQVLAPFSEFPPRSRINFKTFADTSKAAVVSKKGDELAQDAASKKLRILDMSPEEWAAYSQGIRWSQSGRAEDVYREEISIIKKVREPARSVNGLFFIKPDQMSAVYKLFLTLPSVQQLDQNSQLLSISFTDLFQGREVYLGLDRVLIPKKI